MTVRTFEDLEIWEHARDLANRIYKLSKSDKFSRDFGLRDQIRRAAVSILSNIAEGYERGGNQEFIQFLSIAKGSCGEVRCQLYLACDQDYISKTDCDEITDFCKKLSIMVHNFIEYLKQSPYKGNKFKKTV